MRKSEAARRAALLTGAMLLLASCTTSWESDVEANVAADFEALPPEDVAETCEGLRAFGITTAERFVDAGMAVTLEEVAWAESVPDGVTVDEFIEAAWPAIEEACNL